jgi:carboxypeptidase C (cathepsin A)
MAELTALPVDLIRGSHLRVTLWRYVKAVLRDRRRIVGRLDTRFTSIDTDIVGETFENDPSMAMIWGPATRVLNRYVREDLGWEPEPGLSYRTMTPFLKWKPRETEQNGIWTPQLETATQLRASVNRAPNLKVMLQSGYYDLGTPYFPAELTFDHLQFQPEQRANISRKRYESGHMIYLHEPSLAQMKADLVEFLGTLRTPPSV